MIRNLFLLLALYSMVCNSQNSIKGFLNPADNFSWILLYKMENGEQTYIQNADIVEGEFEFELSDQDSPGIYRAYYQIENGLYVEFIYNDENIVLDFNPLEPAQTLQFKKSEENLLHQKYYKTTRLLQKRIDSLQVQYFRSSDPDMDEEIKLAYIKAVEEMEVNQMHFEDLSKEKLAHHIIKASAQFNNSEPLKDPAKYLKLIKEHFFDSIDLTDTILKHTSFVNDRLTDYVFYLNQAEDMETLNLMYQKAIEKAVSWIGAEQQVLIKFLETLLEQYSIEENSTVLTYVLDNHYSRLPDMDQNQELIKKVNSSLKTAIGVMAPDFKWKEEDEVKSLYELSGIDYYVILFFSSDCPHCQVETPEFYKFISDIENIRVVAIGLEDEPENYHKMTEGYSEFINILDLEKWSSQKVKDYGVMSIPAYFVLDSEKRILAKPEDFEELKSMFEEK